MLKVGPQCGLIFNACCLKHIKTVFPEGREINHIYNMRCVCHNLYCVRDTLSGETKVFPQYINSVFSKDSF